MAHIDDIGAKDEVVAHIDEVEGLAIMDDDEPIVVADEAPVDINPADEA